MESAPDSGTESATDAGNGLSRLLGDAPGRPQDQVRPALARARLVCDALARTARLMVGVPDYQAYVAHQQSNHPAQPLMSYEEFFRDRQQARYGFDKGRFRGCC